MSFLGVFLFDMSTTKIILTEEGFSALKSEYSELTTTRRKDIAQKIKEAVALGDLSENAEYDAARDEQAEIEGRIIELGDILKRAEVSKNQSGIVNVGSKVTVQLEANEYEFHLVGGPEANPSLGKISHESPIGQALLGSKVGDKVSVTTPAGEVHYVIITIS